MVGRNEYGLGIRTPEGRRIYKRAVENAGRIQLQQERTKDKKLWKKLDRERQDAMTNGLRDALALNPRPRKKRKTKQA
jgi:hypothetical protein